MLCIRCGLIVLKVVECKTVVCIILSYRHSELIIATLSINTFQGSFTKSKVFRCVYVVVSERVSRIGT